MRRGPSLAVVREQLRVSSLADAMPDRRPTGQMLTPIADNYRVWKKR